MSIRPNILIVEDEVVLSEILRDYLIAAGFNVTVVNTGLGVVEKVCNEQPDLLLLDLMLPEVDGLSICRDVRGFSDVPIVILTARAGEEDCVTGLKLGADDYICKPAYPKEVVARVKTVLRRAAKRDSQPLTQSCPQSNPQSEPSSLYVDEDQSVARWYAKSIVLTPTETRLLSLFTKNPDHVYSRSTLMNVMYLDGRYVSNRTIDSHVKNLRRKLIDICQLGNPIRSIYGVGYKLNLEEATTE